MYCVINPLIVCVCLLVLLTNVDNKKEFSVGALQVVYHMLGRKVCYLVVDQVYLSVL